MNEAVIYPQRPNAKRGRSLLNARFLKIAIAIGIGIGIGIETKLEPRPELDPSLAKPNDLELES